MRLSIFLVLVRLVPAFCTGVAVVPEDNTPKEVEENVDKTFRLLNLKGEDFAQLSDAECERKFFSSLADTRESLVDSWKAGTVDPNVDFQAINPDITTQPEEPTTLWKRLVAFIKKASLWNRYTARRERIATIKAMRQVFILEKEFSQSLKEENEGKSEDQFRALCKYLVEATRHQIKARNAGNGKVDLRLLPEYQEAVNANKQQLDSLSDLLTSSTRNGKEELRIFPEYEQAVNSKEKQPEQVSDLLASSAPKNMISGD